MARHVLSKARYEYDVFLSHASEDKDEVARPLASLLQDFGLRVWFDEFELRVGDNLTAKLNAGISASRFGILLLSSAFFAKPWTNHELDMLENLWVTEDRIMFPIWHQITLQEIRKNRPSLANIVGLSTTIYTVEEIAVDIHEAITEFDDLEYEGERD